MDDFYESTNTVEEALQLITDLRKVVATCSFKIVDQYEHRDFKCNTSAKPHHNSQRIEWHKNNETCSGNWMEHFLAFTSFSAEESSGSEKEEANAAQPFAYFIFHDRPYLIGPAAHVTIRLRILQQNIWGKGLKRPKRTPELFDILQEDENFQPLLVPRHHFSEPTSQITLHIFSDAS